MTSTVMRRLKFAKKIKGKIGENLPGDKKRDNNSFRESSVGDLEARLHDGHDRMGRVTSDEWHNERTTGEPSSFPAQLKHLSLHITHLIWSRLSHCLCHCKTNIEYTVHTGQKHNTCHLTWPHWPEKQGREAHHPTHPGPLREDRGSRCQTL